MQQWRKRIEKKLYTLYKKIENWLIMYNVCNRNITQRALAGILHISVRSITSLSIRNECIIILTDSYIYKIQLYGKSIKKDLKNRTLFYDNKIPLLSPVKVYKKHPFTVRMPILNHVVVDDTAAMYIFNNLKKAGYEAGFRIRDYPFIIEGLNILRKCRYGVQTVKKVKKYLCEKEGTKVHVGVVHGDLHRENIMCKDDRLLLIDFDCVRQRDIQDIDILYFILEEIRHQHGYKKSWLDEWLLIYKNTREVCEFSFYKLIEIDLKFGLILLCLERLAQNYRENILFIEQNRKSIRNINLKLCEL